MKLNSLIVIWMIFLGISSVSCKQKEVVLDSLNYKKGFLSDMYMITEINNTEDRYLITASQDSLSYVIVTEKSLDTKIPPLNGIMIEVGKSYKFNLRSILGEGKIFDQEVLPSSSYLWISEYTKLYLHNYNPNFIGYFFTDNLRGVYYLK